MWIYLHQITGHCWCRKGFTGVTHDRYVHFQFFSTTGSRRVKFGSLQLVSRSVIRHKNPRGKLTHPSQGQELESAGRFTDQTKNSISSKKYEKVLYVTVIYTTYQVLLQGSLIWLILRKEKEILSWMKWITKNWLIWWKNCYKRELIDMHQPIQIITFLLLDMWQWIKSHLFKAAKLFCKV